MKELHERKIPQHIESSLFHWRITVSQLRSLQVVLGVSGIVSAIVVTTFTTDLSPLVLKMASLTSAVCIGIISAFDIGGKANATRAAWRHLNIAVLRYQSVAESTIDNLIDSYAQAEAMIGNVNFKPSASKQE